jgi:hypothetical protein
MAVDMISSSVSRTFVLGAGFSAYAQFPLIRDLKSRVLQTLQQNSLRDLFRPLEDQFRTALSETDPDGTLGFEELLIALLKRSRQARSEDPCHVALALLRTGCSRLLWEIQDGIGGASPCYENFAGWMRLAPRLKPRSAILSFNWDLLAERLLSNATIPWLYSASEPAVVPVLKPHGSINWSCHLREKLQADYPNYLPIMPTSELTYDCMNLFSDPFRGEVNADLRYMIFPGDPELPANDKDVELIWKAAERVIAAREALIFVGYSLPAYDSHSLRFFKRSSHGKQVEAFTPSREHLERFQKELGVPEENLYAERFENSVYGTTNPSG